MNADSSKQLRRMVIFALIAIPSLAVPCAWGAESKGVGDSWATMAWALRVLALLALIVALKAGRIAGAALTAAFWPDLADRASARIAARPVLMFFLGLADAVAGLLILWVLVSLSKPIPPVTLGALIFFLLLIVLALIGLTGIYGCVGRRWTEGDSGPGAIVKGGVMLELGMLIPVLGWLVELLIIVMGLGVGVYLLFERPKAAEIEAQMPEAVPDATSSAQDIPVFIPETPEKSADGKAKP